MLIPDFFVDIDGVFAIIEYLHMIKCRFELSDVMILLSSIYARKR